MCISCLLDYSYAAVWDMSFQVVAAMLDKLDNPGDCERKEQWGTRSCSVKVCTCTVSYTCSASTGRNLKNLQERNESFTICDLNPYTKINIIFFCFLYRIMPSEVKIRKSTLSCNFFTYIEQQDANRDILDSQASRASTSSSPKTPIVILESKASCASTSSSPKTPIVILDSEDSPAFESSQVADRFCDICMDTKTESEMFRNTKVCGHMFCFDCIRGHVAANIQENITKVRCPDPDCKGVIGPEECRLIVPREVLERWEDALCESLILGTEKFYCPFKDCSALLVDDGGGTVTSSECPHCNKLFCAQCKVTWHSGMDCSEYQSLKKDKRDPNDIKLMNLAKKKKWKRCPKCNFYVQKNRGCDIIHCRLDNKLIFEV